MRNEENGQLVLLNFWELIAVPGDSLVCLVTPKKGPNSVGKPFLATPVLTF